jgi:hypothetical protein
MVLQVQAQLAIFINGSASPSNNAYNPLGLKKEYSCILSTRLVD